MKLKRARLLIKIPGIPDSYAKQISDLFKPLPKDAELILFGSRAKGNAREGSDIDIAIKGPSVSLEDRDKWLLKYDDLNLPWKLDVVVYKFIKEPAFKEHIDRVGIHIL